MARDGLECAPDAHHHVLSSVQLPLRPAHTSSLICVVPWLISETGGIVATKSQDASKL